MEVVGLSRNQPEALVDAPAGPHAVLATRAGHRFRQLIEDERVLIKEIDHPRPVRGCPDGCGQGNDSDTDTDTSQVAPVKVRLRRSRMA